MHLSVLLDMGIVVLLKNVVSLKSFVNASESPLKLAELWDVSVTRVASAFCIA